ncbi:MAG: tyrosine-type recombinase/integrase [Patescibacteria group bacterium]|nr:tyrosine-type recombinase/integrase [Patescibacteria group bacterium]
MNLQTYTQVWARHYLPVKAPATRRTLASRLATMNGVFGQMELPAINDTAVQDWVNKAQETLAPKTIANNWSALRVVLVRAKRDGLIAQVPMPELPRNRRAGKQPWLSLEEIRRLLAASPIHRPITWVLAETGLRIGELLGLTWDAIDPDNRTLEVRHSVYAGQSQDTKTVAAERTLAVSEDLLRLVGSLPRRSNYVFTTGKGTPLWPAEIGKQYRQLASEVGIDWTGFHAIRHGARMVWTQLGMPEVLIEQRMGHAIPGVRGVYLHQLGTDAPWAARIADTLKEGIRE